MDEEESWAHSLTHNTSGVGGHVETLG